MSMPVDADTFDQMVDQDIEWLIDNAPESFIYRDRIVKCLQMAKKYYREVDLPNKGESEWDW
jgi:hypothetical protein